MCLLICSLYRKLTVQTLKQRNQCLLQQVVSYTTVFFSLSFTEIHDVPSTATCLVNFPFLCFLLSRYLTGMVDKRTLEKYEREAKEKNRETWWERRVLYHHNNLYFLVSINSTTSNCFFSSSCFVLIYVNKF